MKHLNLLRYCVSMLFLYVTICVYPVEISLKKKFYLQIINHHTFHDFDNNNFSHTMLFLQQFSKILVSVKKYECFELVMLATCLLIELFKLFSKFI